MKKPITKPADSERMFMQIGIQNENEFALFFFWAIEIDVRQFPSAFA